MIESRMMKQISYFNNILNDVDNIEVNLKMKIRFYCFLMFCLKHLSI